MKKILIAYYSRADENYVGGSLKYLSVGNTEVLAKKIAEKTGGELFKIEQETPYSAGYNDCIEEARRDQRTNARPKLKKDLASVADYDEIYLGYPNYWGTMPMAVFTFLEKFYWSDKRIIPFCTNEGSGLGSSVRDIKSICKGANVSDGLSIIGHETQDSAETIINWAKNEIKNK